MFADLTDPLFIKTAIVIALTPIIWNIIARLEYYTHFLTKLAGGNKYYGCYALATYIFCFSAYRDYLFDQTMRSQAPWDLLASLSSITHPVAYVLFAVGGIFVLSSMWALGITGTYLGDYFGILMDAPVTSFPFNVLNDPMYDGACMLFLSQALLKNSGAGVALTLWVFVCYRIALIFEGSFTAKIYAEKDKHAQKVNKASTTTSSPATPSSEKKRKSKKLD